MRRALKIIEICNKEFRGMRVINKVSENIVVGILCIFILFYMLISPRFRHGLDKLR